MKSFRRSITSINVTGGLPLASTWVANCSACGLDPIIMQSPPPPPPPSLLPPKETIDEQFLGACCNPQTRRARPSSAGPRSANRVVNLKHRLCCAEDEEEDDEQLID